MIKRCLYLLAAGLAMPILAQGNTLNLPADATIDVHVIETLTLDTTTPEQADVLLQPIASQGATHQLPDYCLITATASLIDQQVRITANTLTCIEPTGDAPEIFSAEISATGRESNGDFGIDACTSMSNGACQSATLTPEHHFTLELGQALAIEPQDNPSARINEQRRRAGDDNDDTSSDTSPSN
ncbi:hypothetical protein [Pistricoccus aurantiacus]|uniref:hypothetical protein n=1 Tax=Pistricoccus aurantiacus TaxID=1883414 RepID=UPI0036297061